ncbi:unnamed protein product [Alopecurus aequalis]
MGIMTSRHRADAANTADMANAVQGLHVFEISGYRQRRERPTDCCESPVFAACGHDWQIRTYLGGLTHTTFDHVAMYLCLRGKISDGDAKVMASVQLSFVDVTGSSPPHTTQLEASPYLRDNRLTVACLITIIKDDNSINVPDVATEVRPPDITEHLERLLRGKEETDVVFVVGTEEFPAHKTVLGMRSPVFKAEVHGVMRENNTNRITIGDMQPAVFEALLHFIYTDSLSPAMNGLNGNDYREMIRHLLVAADRYAMERLKDICESILCKTLDVKTVVTTLALADQHHCDKLKEACIKYVASLGGKEIDGVVASKGYVELKETSPSALFQLWEKTGSLRDSKCSAHVRSVAGYK